MLKQIHDEEDALLPPSTATLSASFNPKATTKSRSTRRKLLKLSASVMGASSLADFDRLILRSRNKRCGK